MFRNVMNPPNGSVFFRRIRMFQRHQFLFSLAPKGQFPSTGPSWSSWVPRPLPLDLLLNLWGSCPLCMKPRTAHSEFATRWVPAGDNRTLKVSDEPPRGRFLLCSHPLLSIRASLVVQTVKRLAAMQETRAPSLGGEDPLEEGIATHSCILAWRIPMDRGAWWATVHGVAKSRTRLSD